MDGHHPLHLLSMLPGKLCSGVVRAEWAGATGDTPLCLFLDSPVWHHVFRLSGPLLLDASDSGL